MEINETIATSMGVSEFVALALSEGYCYPQYWVDQYFDYQSGNRGPDMHDFTLANLSKS